MRFFKFIGSFLLGMSFIFLFPNYTDKQIVGGFIGMVGLLILMETYKDKQ